MTKDRALSRRAVLLAGLGGIAAMTSAAQAQQGAPDPASPRFSMIVVDTSRLADLGIPSTAAAIQRQLARDVADIFADRMAVSDKRAPQLVLRIDSIQLAAYAGDSGILNPGETNTDYLEGAGLVVSNGQVLSTTPILAALDASYSGAWHLPDIDDRRVASISHHFAYWLRRQMGL